MMCRQCGEVYEVDEIEYVDVPDRVSQVTGVYLWYEQPKGSTNCRKCGTDLAGGSRIGVCGYIPFNSRDFVPFRPKGNQTEKIE